MAESITNEILNNSIQSRAKEDNPVTGDIGYVIYSLAKANDLIPAWWSTARDFSLRAFWKTSDQLSGAINAVSSRMTTIPFKVVAKDMSIKAHTKLADEYTEYIMTYSELGEGWNVMFQKFVEDYLSQDNGAFLEVIGDGKKNGAIKGMAVGMAHLDSSRCTRTGNPLYPVVYNDVNGKQYKLHYTRVIYASQMPSPISKMNGVGFCGVSRAINASQNLIDISIYKQEKLGSRAQRQLMVTQGGLDPEDIRTAIAAAERSMTAQGMRRFSKSIAIGSATLPDAKVDVIDLASLPDGFDEESSTFIGMSVIALALGIDVREIYPVSMGGGTKADAIIQHIKQRGKTVGQIIELFESNIGKKFLPPFLKLVFDFQDDAQDRQEAEIRNIRSTGRQRDLNMRVTSPRVERERMVENGELTREQFEELELNDGRMPDGVSVDVLFFDPQYSEFLSGTTKENYEQKMDDIMLIISTSKSPDKVRKARYALAAIKHKFEFPVLQEKQLALQMQMRAMGQKQPQEGKPKTTQNIKLNDNMEINGEDNSYQNDKLSNTLPRNPTSAPNDIGAINK